jgi:hypothetical protein
MKFGADQVIACPHCKTLARVQTIASGNTFGARTWTDGKTIAPMLPSIPFITKCHKCNRFFWLKNAKVIGEVPYWATNLDKEFSEAWINAERVKTLTESEYLEAIELNDAPTKIDALNLRICAWQAGNDTQRSIESNVIPSQTTQVRSLQAITNMEWLLEGFNAKDYRQQLMKAELLRELERFAESIQILESEFPIELQVPKQFIYALASKKEAKVQEFLRSKG